MILKPSQKRHRLVSIRSRSRVSVKARSGVRVGRVLEEGQGTARVRTTVSASTPVAGLALVLVSRHLHDQQAERGEHVAQRGEDHADDP